MKKMIAILLIMSISILPAVGLAGNAFDTLKELLDKPATDIKLPEGFSITNEPDADTSDGILAMLSYRDDGNSVMISGINGEGKFEIRMYSNLTIAQILYYSYIVSANYAKVQNQMPAGARFSILVSYGEEGMIFINDEAKADQFRETIVSAVEKLANK